MTGHILYEMSWKSKTIKNEDFWMSSIGKIGRQRMAAEQYGVSLWGDENVLELNRDGIKRYCECGIVHFGMVNF